VSSSTCLGINAAEHFDDPFNIWVSHSPFVSFVHSTYTRFFQFANVVQISFGFGGRWVGVGAGSIYGWSQSIGHGVVLIEFRA